jgi:dipeptidyl aminopeptidase/acylaminoacyl peptidase
MTRGRWAISGVSVLAVMLALIAVAMAAPGATGPKWIVFSGDANGAGLQQLFRIRTTGAEIRQITTGALPAVSPSFSPSGTRIAFTRLGSGIFAMNLDGSGLRRLTSNSRDSYPVWSPDGKRIAFIRLYRNAWRLFTISPTGQNPQRLPQSPPAGRPSWTADGKSIYIPSTGDLVKVDSTTGRIQKYYGVPLDVQTGQTATVSPNGRMTAFVNPRRSTGPPDCGEGRCQQFGLYLANVAAPHRMRKIVDDAGAAGWSPDNRTIVYAAKGVLTFRIVASGALRTVDTGTHVVSADAGPAWQPR